MYHHRLIVTLVAAFSGSVVADVVFVDDDNCPGPGSGTERDPFCTIQTAIDNAVDTDEILVAPGTYFETINFLGKAIWLHSSDGAEVTTIDGTGFFHVVQCVTGEGLDTVLDGFTITGGNANGSFPDSVGGGMYNLASSPTVANCSFSGNSASLLGGVIYNANNSPTVIDCVLSGNSATYGGGMFNLSSSPTVTGCTISGNSADEFGGGMYNLNGSNPTVTDCVFIGNWADSFGGGMANITSSPTVTNCTFIDNAGVTGGGMYNGEAGSDLTVTDCTFDGNTADSGGGIYNANSSLTVNNCSFNENSAVFNGGGMNNASSSPIVTNCLFNANTAVTNGGGMYSFASSSPTVTDCTFRRNSVVGLNGSGGGMSNFGSSIVTNCMFTDNFASRGGGMSNDGSSAVTNCTFTGNTAGGNNHGGGMSNPGQSFATVTNCILWGNTPNQLTGDTTLTVRYNDVQGGWGGTGNIDADPLFVDPVSGDYRLQAGSPCIDAGHNWAIAGLTDTDLDGNPRFAADKIDFDPGCGIPVVVDMGAYEYQGDPFPVKFGDITGDGVVGINDFLDLLAAWGACTEACCLADLDLDGNVGITDFLLLLGNWG